MRIRRTHTVRFAFVLALFALGASALAGEMTLNIIQYPDRRSVDVPFVTTDRAPTGATLTADVDLKEGQARIDINYRKMQPAALFGGNITAYTVWAVSRAGLFENLGELWIDGESGDVKFQTGMKEFAMFVTAEPVPGIWRPSDMVVFSSGPTTSQYAKNSTLQFNGFGMAMKHDRESIGLLKWTGKEPIPLYQARRSYEIAAEMQLEQYDEKSMREAKTTLAQATNAQSGSSKVMTDYSRRTVALVTTAARAMYKAAQEKAAAEAAARRQAELDALSTKAAEAEKSAAAADAARKQAQEAETQANLLRSRAEVEKNEAEKAKADMAAAAAALEAQKKDLESQMAALKAEKDGADKSKADAVAATAALDAQKKDLEAQMAAMAVENQRIGAERDAMAQRLLGALMLVADTQNTARGVVVNLSDILFDTGKATLKTEAQVSLAKMCGVLAVFPNLNLRIEGYTDSTGTDEINNKLSHDRAATVMVFLQGQGIQGSRMTSDGYGSKFPVASNDTNEGRAKNRRVAVVVAEGVIAAPTR
ncbi:MAG TPA: OmpA family protein [Thermoanaerobaculia bacterium]|nr:OmpA family protein [Thermoanaerobaculia bacterium]